MSQANVISSASNVVWYTDKCELTALSGGVTYQIYVTALGSASPIGNLYSNAVAVAANTRQQIYVGAGNKITITGTFTARELGTQSSAQYSVFNAAGN
jgi:hypothetical protein